MIEKELPNGWELMQIKDFAESQSGGTPSTTRKEYWDGDVPWINSGKLKDCIISEPSKYITELGLKESSARMFPKGTVVIALTGATTGKVGLLGIDTSTNQSVTGIFPNNFYNSKFLFYQLIHLRNEILSFALGTAQPHINKRIVDETWIKFPPLAEQKRIVAKLDEAFQHLDTLKAKLARIPELLKTFRQTVLTQAVTGKLSKEWREENSEFENTFSNHTIDNMREVKIQIPENWIWLPFSSVASIESNLVEPLHYLEFPLIAPDNIESETGKLISKPLVSEIMPRSAKHYFTNGSIVYSKIRPYLSKLIIVNFTGLCSADMYPINTALETKYLYYYMLTGLFLSYATTAGERSVLPKINQKGLNIIPVSVPPQEEQKEIVKKVEALFAKADVIEAYYNTLKEKIDQLPKALLAKAFRGELVSQNPEDEPASVMLKKLNLIKRKPKYENQKSLDFKI